MGWLRRWFLRGERTTEPLAIVTRWQEERQAAQDAWLATLPPDLQAELAPLPPHDIDTLMAMAANTSVSDRANAVRRWRTLPDQPPNPLIELSISERVDYLFRTQRRPDGVMYTDAEIAAAFDGQVDLQALAELRAGTTDQPDIQLLFQRSLLPFATVLIMTLDVAGRYALAPQPAA
jgi:hypothetical protein